MKIGLVLEESGPYQAAYITQWGTATKAAADYINKERGGFGGRQVEVVECDSESTTAGALTCANKMAAAKVDFVTGYSLNFGPNGVPVLEKAGIPVQMFPIATQDYTAANSFPLAGGSAASYPARALYSINKGEKVAVFTAVDSVPAQLALKQLEPIYQQAGGSVLNALIPASSADVAPTIAKIMQAKPEVVINSLSGVKGAALYAGLFAQGLDPSKVFGSGTLVDVDNFYAKVQPQAALEGSIYELECASPDDVTNPDVAVYRKAMKDYTSIEGRSQNALLGFSVVMTNFKLAESMGFANFTKESMAKAYSTQTVPVFAGASYSRAAAPKDYPAIGNPYVKYVRYAGGKIENVQEGWTNSATGKTEDKP
ncbi:ABC transporter substrate-binding protein [Pseudonocardia sp. GCM10023141]|uniref:ABC transporter substrate-binding protein n=1 Tax=Pseudonocardia sp. GCM10023141 TaxID=3252653 RepID=UPI00361E13DB